MSKIPRGLPRGVFNLITLLTDFGSRDNFVGVMKGVILGINPQAVIVDLGHDLPAHDPAMAAFSLMTARPYFPEGAVHLAVVDPGVGTNRAILAVRAFGQIFVAPDNGLLGYVLDQAPAFEARRVENPEWHLKNPSQTFHGRDIMAPAAAHLSLGKPLEEAGPVHESPRRLAPLRPETGPGIVRGRVIYVDRFGNLITNIPNETALAAAFPRFSAGGRTIAGLSRAYGEAAEGEYLALPGSHGFVEIARNAAPAESPPGLTLGTEIRLETGP